VAFDGNLAEFFLLGGPQPRNIAVQSGMGAMNWYGCFEAGLGLEPVVEIAARNPTALLKEMIGVIANGIGRRQQGGGMLGRIGMAFAHGGNW